MEAKLFWKSKVWWLNIIALVLLLLPVIADVPALVEYRELIGTITAILNIVWRWGTDIPLKATRDGTNQS